MGEIAWDDYTWESLPGEQEYPDAGAVILLDEAHAEISRLENLAFSTMHRHRIVKILNESGYHHANFVIPFDDDTEVLNLEARTIRPNGDIVPLNKSRVFETSLYPDYVFYSDARGKRFTMPAVEPGCVLEFRWQLQVRNFTFWTRWPFQQTDPVLISRFAIRCPRSWDIDWKSYVLDIQPKIISSEGSFVEYQWEVRDLEPLRAEVGRPAGMREIPSLMFAPVHMRHWDDVARWYLSLAGDRMKPDRFITQIVDSLIRDAANDREKLQRIYEFVRDRVRYLAIEIGIGGYQPHPAPEILANLYGDCKDMTTLIAAMAEAAGIDADPVLISTWQNGEMDTSVVSPAHFNHAIAMAVLPDSEIWMDATDKICAFGQLPWYDQNRLVVVVNDSGKAVIRRTPVTGKDGNQSRRKWSVSLEDTARVRGMLEMDFTGTPARNLRQLLRYQSKKELDTWCTQEVLFRFPGAEADTFYIRGLDRYHDTLSVNIRFQGPLITGAENSFFTFQPGTWSRFDWHELFVSGDRQSDITLQYPLIVQDEIEITLPESWTVISGQGRESLHHFFGGYYFHVETADSSRIRMKRYLRLSETRLNRSDYSEFRTFLNDVAALDRKAVVCRVR